MGFAVYCNVIIAFNITGEGISMKITLHALILMVFIASISAAANAASRLYTEHSSWDFKTVEEGDTLTHTFRIVNKSTETINIDHNIIIDRPANIQVTLDKYELEVDEVADLNVVLDTAGLGNRQIVSFIYLSYQDKTVALTIKGSINPKPIPLLQLSPMINDFGLMEQGEAKKSVFKYANVGKGILKLKKILFITRDKGFDVVGDISKLEIAKDDEGEFEIGFRGWRNGMTEGFLLIESNSGGDPGTITKVDLKAIVIPKVRGLVIEPPNPVLRDEGGKPRSFNINLKNNYPFDVIISPGDNGDTVLVNRNQSKLIELELIESEAVESMKFGIEIILPSKRPPVISQPVPVTPEAADTTSVAE